jgi:putative FmdB family regulatory protein
MPVYEYEPSDHDCLMCDGRVAVIQGIHDSALKYCPHCGLGVRRVISQVTIKLEDNIPQDKAAQKGFITYRRAEKGVWEKISGEGPDLMVGTKQDMAAVEAEKAADRKVIDLDKSD